MSFLSCRPHPAHVPYLLLQGIINGLKQLQRKTAAARFTKFAGYLHWGVSFSGKKNSLILENKMAATGISLKIIYIFLLAVSNW